MNALILAPFDSIQLDRLRSAMTVEYESWLDTRKLTDPEDLARRIRASGISILVLEADFVFEETFQHAPSLQFVGICRDTTSHVDIEAATRHGVLVVNTPARTAHAVAEHALGLMLALARSIPQAHNFIANGKWNNPAEAYISMRGIELRGRAIGIVGLGAIGSELARICIALNMNVLAYDPFAPRPEPPIRMTTLERLAERSDFISIHVPVSDHTFGMMNEEIISKIKRSAFLVNCSDPATIDESALVSALDSRRIAGAALDVFETHPIAPDSPLRKLHNVILTPHIGGATAETIQRHSQMMTDDILSFIRGERPANLVNADAWR